MAAAGAPEAFELKLKEEDGVSTRRLPFPELHQLLSLYIILFAHNECWFNKLGKTNVLWKALNFLRVPSDISFANLTISG